MTILPPSSTSNLPLPQIEVPDPWTEHLNSQIPWKPSDRILEEAIGKVLNLEEIIDRLHATDCQHCAPFTTEQVKFAFLKWLQNNLDSLEMQPEWFINREPKHFERYLPEIDNGYFPEEEYDPGVLHEEQIAQLAAELTATDNPSQLEDDFEGTPEQAAIAALDW